MSLIPSLAAGKPVAQVAQTAQEERSCATFATCAGQNPAPELNPARRSTAYTPIPEPGPGAEAQFWLDWYYERCAIREKEANYPRPLAERLTYDEAVSRWHLLHGERHDLARCGGCGQLLSGGDVLKLPDGARVHIDEEWTCLRAYGKQWRDGAIKGLAVVGILPPGAFQE